MTAALEVRDIVTLRDRYVRHEVTTEQVSTFLALTFGLVIPVPMRLVLIESLNGILEFNGGAA